MTPTGRGLQMTEGWAYKLFAPESRLIRRENRVLCAQGRLPMAGVILPQPGTLLPNPGLTRVAGRLNTPAPHGSTAATWEPASRKRMRQKHEQARGGTGDSPPSLGHGPQQERQTMPGTVPQPGGDLSRTHGPVRGATWAYRGGHFTQVRDALWVGDSFACFLKQRKAPVADGSKIL